MNEQQFSPDRKNNCYIDFTGAAQRMQEDIAAFEATHPGQSGLQHILEDISQRHSAQEMIHRVAGGLGVLLNPRDLSTGVPTYGVEEVMVVTNIGTTIGLGLCRKQLLEANIAPKELVPQGLKGCGCEPPKSPKPEFDDLVRLHEAARGQVEYSSYGLALIDPGLTETIEDWLDEAVPNIRLQGFARTGLGIFLRNANHKLQECDAYRMRHEANAGVSWDDLLGYCQKNPGS